MLALLHLPSVLLSLISPSSVSAAPIPRPQEGFAAVNSLLAGNVKFQETMKTSNPGLLQLLVNSGQAPQSYMLACSDSRGAPEVFTSSLPGTMFTDRNIANQFPDHTHGGDDGAATVLTYAVEELGVKHIIVMGHYGCGGVAAAIASPPAQPLSEGNARVQAWIQPIRELWGNSTVPEIVAARAAYGDRTDVPEPDIADPAFRRLVEENVKRQVSNAASDPIVKEQWEAYMANPYFQTDPKQAVWVHGMVYDIETGELKDLGVSKGPGSEEGGAPVTEGAPAEGGGEAAAAATESAAAAPAAATEGAVEGGAAAVEAAKVVAMPGAPARRRVGRW